MYKYILGSVLLITLGVAPVSWLQARMEHEAEHHEIQHHQIQHHDIQHSEMQHHPNEMHPNEHHDVNRNLNRDVDRHAGEYGYGRGMEGKNAVVVPMNEGNNNGGGNDNYDPNAEEDALYNQDVQQSQQTPSQPQTINVNVGGQGGSQ